MTPDFLAHLQTIPGSCSQQVKENHWHTWCVAQAALIAAIGAAAEIKVTETESANS